jgi:predicted Zn-dependent protease
MGARPLAERPAALTPLLSDGYRSVRLEAARGLLDVPRAALPPAALSHASRVQAELRASLEHNADRAGALLDLARLELVRAPGDSPARDQVQALFQRALELEPTLAAVYINYADYLREQGRDAEAIAILEVGLDKSRDDAPLEHALGLAWVRSGDKNKALEHLARAHQLAPDSARLGYVYAVGLFDAGKQQQAIDVLERLRRTAPGDLSLLEALARYTRLSGNAERASALERELADARRGPH